MSIEVTEIKGLASEHNTAGCYRLHLVDVDDVDTVPDEVMGNVPGDIVLYGGKVMTSIQPTTFEMFFHEDTTYDNGSPRVDGLIEWVLPKDRLSLLPTLHGFHRLRVVAVLETFNPDPANVQDITRLLVGNKEEPAMAFLVKRKSGADPRNDRSDYTLQVRWTRSTPAPFYNGTPPDLLAIVDCPTRAQLIALATGAEVWGDLSTEQRTDISALVLSSQTGSEIWDAMTTLQRVQAINSNTGAELWAMMNTTVQAQVLAAAGVVTVTRINNSGPPYTDVIIDPTS